MGVCEENMLTFLKLWYYWLQWFYMSNLSSHQFASNHLSKFLITSSNHHISFPEWLVKLLYCQSGSDDVRGFGVISLTDVTLPQTPSQWFSWKPWWVDIKMDVVIICGRVRKFPCGQRIAFVGNENDLQNNNLARPQIWIHDKAFT